MKQLTDLNCLFDIRPFKPITVKPANCTHFAAHEMSMNATALHYVFAVQWTVKPKDINSMAFEWNFPKLKRNLLNLHYLYYFNDQIEYKFCEKCAKNLYFAATSGSLCCVCMRSTAI